MTRLFDRILGEHIALTVQLSSEPSFVRADASMMEQVLLNLVVNARDAMPRGGRLTLRTTIERLDAETLPDHVEARPGTFVRMTASDTGSGISADVLPYVFEPFFTTKDRERATGLGLATVYGVVKQHDGWVTVRSVVDAGTTFDVYLPAVAAPAKNDSAIAVSERTTSHGGETILLVEDDEAVRHLARLLLERRKYRVLEASSGPSALARWREHQAPIDLILTDLVLPGGLSGLELVDELRTARPTVKVLLTSGYSVDIAGKKLALAGDTRFLAKPYTATQLTTAVRDCLDGTTEGVSARG
jgi:two-component system, cell cycle sensor histidine kinase and response regulator CckA